MKSKEQAYFSKVFIVFIILIFNLIQCKKEVPVQAEGKPEESAVKYIAVAEGGLNIREVPELNGKVVHLVPNYSLIELLEEVGSTLNINDKEGKWAKVRHDGKSGYAFSGYISKAKIVNTQQNQDNSYYYTLYSLSSSTEDNNYDCTTNYMNFGCLVVVYKSDSNGAVNAFDSLVAENWIDKTHLAESWSIGDAGYGGSGIRSVDIFTKNATDIWKMESAVMIESEKNELEYERICLKNTCFDTKKNPDIISQLKTNRAIKYYNPGDYKETISSYISEIPIGENDFIIYIPDKNVVIKK